MKKLFKAAIAALAVAILAVALVGCTANVGGKTYVYSEVKMEIPEGASTIEQGLMTTAKGIVETLYQNAEYTFNADGTMGGTAVGSWSQDGNRVTLTAAGPTALNFTASGSKLLLSVDQSGYSMTVVFVKK